ncbi:hypothetical protein PHMEG_00029930, partial [Phytophthora megakarya]
NVYLVPDLPHTLLSVSKLWRDGHKVSFGPSSCTIATGSRGRTACIARLVGGVYSVVTEPQHEIHARHAQGLSAAALGRTLEMWHRRLGHVNNKDCQRQRSEGRWKCGTEGSVT